MGPKSENEITIKVISTEEELINRLEIIGFKKGINFSMNDYYFVPSDVNLDKLSGREILSKAILIRHTTSDEKVLKKIIFKIKDIDDNGNIMSQKAIGCDVLNIDDAKNLLKAIGYIKIMNIKEDDTIYYRDSLKLVLKVIKDGDILIEIETDSNTEWNTVEKLKQEVEKMNLPIEKENFFVKKAEDMLNKIKHK